jgi:hypothetical protein
MKITTLVDSAGGVLHLNGAAQIVSSMSKTIAGNRAVEWL